MKKFIVQAILLILIITGALIFANPTGNPKILPLPFMPQQARTSQLQINGNMIKVEIAASKEARKKGLGGRASLAESEGMLFIFDSLDKHPFWMKGLSFPLDFIWIKDTEIVDILPDIPPPSPGQSDSTLPIYTSKVPANKVLEVKGGTAKKFNIKAGDLIKLIP